MGAPGRIAARRATEMMGAKYICKHSTLRFESEPVRAALATDSCIGAMISPSTPGSGYVLLHHVMGELDGIRGAWGYPEGGMGAVSGAIAKSAISVHRLSC